MGRPPKKFPRRSTSLRFSKRDDWWIEALVEQGYGEGPTEVLRQGLWLLVKQAQNEGRLPRKPTRRYEDIPAPEDDDPPEAA